MVYQSQFIARFGTTGKTSYPVKSLREVALDSGEYGANTPATKFNPIKGRYIRITDITDTGDLNDDIVSPELTDDKYLLKNGDLLFARTGATVGKTYLHREGNAIFAGYLIRYQFTDEVLPEFVFAYTHSAEYYQWVALTQKVGAQPNISAKQYDNLRVIVPPIKEQQTFIGITRQADKSKFAGFKSQFIEMFGGKDYPLMPIRDFAEITTGSTPSKSHPEYWGGNNPWVSAEDMKDKYVYDTVEKVTDKGYATCKHLPAETLMYVCRGSIGVMAINKVECATNQSICTATCKTDKCEVEFLYHSLLYKKDEIKQIGIGTNFKSLNQSTFSNLRISMPTIEEQRSFVSVVTRADKSKYLN